MAHVRGRVAERLEGDAAWAIDRLEHEYTGGSYPRELDRVVFLLLAENAVAHDYS